VEKTFRSIIPRLYRIVLSEKCSSKMKLEHIDGMEGGEGGEE